MRSRAFVLTLLAILAIGASNARADGDPGSDVLVYQPLFVTSDAGVPIAEQVRLGALLRAASKAGFPIRVAIIASPSDLGAVTELWQKPHAYARFLGLELSLAYRGRLLVVMPNGLGFSWPGHSTAAAYRALGGSSAVPGAGGLAARAEHAVSALAAAVHVRLGLPSTPARNGQGNASHRSTTRPASGSSAGSARLRALAALVGLAALAFVLRLGYTRRTALTAAAHRALRSRPRAVRAALTASVLIAAGLGAYLLLARPGPAPNQADALASNPVLDPGTPLARAAPDFTLRDQFGQPVSLRSFRGKVVILAFNDSECTTLCPLTTSAMLDAKAMLGPAGDRVQLLGIDANPKATSLEDVLSYSQLHGMLHAWRFLTGPLSALQRVWKAYSIGVQISQRQVDHTPAVFVIDTHGRLDRLYVTQQSYAAVGQLGEELATEAARLLPDHPSVNGHLSYTRIAGITPTEHVALRAADGGTVTAGPGTARLYLFFATWDQQLTGLAGGLQGLGRYNELARRAGLPAVAAVDEGSVEPAGALTRFLAALPRPLPYPVAVDRDGRLADGYEVEGLPWLVLISPTGHIAWYYSIAAVGWPSTKYLTSRVKEALARAAGPPATLRAALAQLEGSPPPLATLHRQSAQLLGGAPQLSARVRALRGYPIVINAWASWCTPCRSEFGLFASASARYGRQVAFLGADTSDSSSDARAFLAQHPVSYPSYQATTLDLRSLAVIGGLPTTVFIDRSGRVAYVHTGQYNSQGTLDGDITSYALRP